MLFDDQTAAGVREPAVAGAFYPGSPTSLRMMLQDLLDAAKPDPVPGEIMGLACPHAGYQYSGLVAAHGYKLLMGKNFDVVFVLAPSHQEYFRGASVFPGRAYKTPLGIVPVDTELAHKVAHASEFASLSWYGHRGEHALEVQLPFLQMVLTDLRIVPIVIGEFDYEICTDLGRALASVARGRRALFVASTDLYHGYSYEECVSTDERTLRKIVSWDVQGLCDGLLTGVYQACGGGPVATSMIALRELGANHAEVVTYTNSADVTGERGGWTVGYAAVAFSKT